MPYKPLPYFLTIAIAFVFAGIPAAAQETYAGHLEVIHDSVAELKFRRSDRIAIEEIVDAHYQWESEILRETLDADLIEIGRSRSKAQERTKKIGEHEEAQAAIADERAAVIDTLSQLADITDSAKKIEKHLKSLSDAVEAEVARLENTRAQLKDTREDILEQAALISGSVQTAIEDIGTNATAISQLGTKIDQLPRSATSSP